MLVYVLLDLHASGSGPMLALWIVAEQRYHCRELKVTPRRDP